MAKPQQGCALKTVYSTKAKAERIAKRIRRRKADEIVVAYHCKPCHGWHVGGDHLKGK
ncbi:hypothetical protein [Candidatus Korobacter versatilis]|uniref:hypothetical protein n=1 Tax=Candidatus Korobacter versatilis TaxID=658062 RepID=UPI0003152B5C|nr:hypothetical protein [Candidatus Koribacter versatilis]